MHPTTKNKVPFNVQREKELFLDAPTKLVNMNKVSNSAPTLPSKQVREMPKILNQIFQKKPTGKVSKIK